MTQGGIVGVPNGVVDIALRDQQRAPVSCVGSKQETGMDDVWTQRSELLGRSFGVQSLRSWWPGRMPADRVGSEPDSGGAAVALARLGWIIPSPYVSACHCSKINFCVVVSQAATAHLAGPCGGSVLPCIG